MMILSYYLVCMLNSNFCPPFQFTLGLDAFCIELEPEGCFFSSPGGRLAKVFSLCFGLLGLRFEHPSLAPSSRLLGLIYQFPLSGFCCLQPLVRDATKRSMLLGRFLEAPRFFSRKLRFQRSFTLLATHDRAPVGCRPRLE